MKIAVTIWEDRISPVFDASRRLLIADIENARIGERSILVFDPAQPSVLAKTLTDLDVKVLICGAISQFPATIINAADIALNPFITGEVDRVLDALARGNSLEPAFFNARLPWIFIRNRQIGTTVNDHGAGADGQRSFLKAVTLTLQPWGVSSSGATRFP